MTRAIIASTIVSLFVVACAAEDADSLNGRNGRGGENGGDPNAPGEDGVPGPGEDGTTPGGPNAPTCQGQPHIGFAGFDFVSDRKPGDVGVNRRRVKPYGTLRTEFQRTLGVIPAGLAAAQAAYGEVPARWYAEPTAGAVSLYTTYTLAFGSCYDTMTGANFQAMPTAATAQTECAAMQRKFWQRTATPDETKACADFIMGLTTEASARRRWAHGCASIMTSTGFTTY